jgi:hypothetical protein
MSTAAMQRAMLLNGPSKNNVLHNVLYSHSLFDTPCKTQMQRTLRTCNAAAISSSSTQQQQQQIITETAADQKQPTALQTLNAHAGNVESKPLQLSVVNAGFFCTDRVLQQYNKHILVTP